MSGTSRISNVVLLWHSLDRNTACSLARQTLLNFALALRNVCMSSATSDDCAVLTILRA